MLAAHLDALAVAWRRPHVLGQTLRPRQRLPLGAADGQQDGGEQKMRRKALQGTKATGRAPSKTVRHRTRRVKATPTGATGYPVGVRLARLILLATLLLALPAPAQDVEAEATIGWGRTLRQGRFNPATVELLYRGRVARPARLEWYVPQLGRTAFVLQQDVLLNPGTSRYAASLPVGPAVEAIHLTVVDPQTNRLLAFWQSAQRDRLDLANRLVLGEGPDLPALVAVAGRGELPALATTDALVEAVELDDLPREPRGYDALDVLVLDRPALATLDLDVQAAVAQWTRGGGHLWIRLDRLALPPAAQSPLADLLLSSLPGPPATIEVDADNSPYLRLAGQAGDAPVTTVPADGGFLSFFHGPIAQVPEAALDPLPLRQVQEPEATPRLSAESAFDPQAYSRLALPILCLIGPIDWLALRLAGRPRRRTAGRVSLAATVLAIACVAVLAVTTPPSPDAIGRTTGPFVDRAINTSEPPS